MKPNEEQIKRFWDYFGVETRLVNTSIASDRVWTSENQYPPIDLNNLFKYVPDIIVGITFRYFPGGCECELTYITEAGFDTVKSWVKNESGEKESKKLTALALFWAINQLVEAAHD